MPIPEYRFEIAFSYANPHREKVRAIAEIVSAEIDPDIGDRGKGRVFFDEWFEHEILGPNMRFLLQRVYFEQSRMVLADLSTDYAVRSWCQAENEAIDALRMTIDSAQDETARLRLLNVKFDDGRVPGVFPNTGHLDVRSRTVEQCAQLVLKRHELLLERMSSVQDPDPLARIVAAPAPRFFHPATNDDRYSRRETELIWLDSAAMDPRVRIATITGQGGLGKTALVGHWIEKHDDWEHRTFRGVFFYSFYSNRDPETFFRAFLEYVYEVENVRPTDNSTPLYHRAAFACRKWDYLVVLDGLEILQYGEDDPAHFGWIADGELTEFVARVGADGSSLLVLTSRFPFPRITDEHPDAARALELPLFTETEGADLLSVCGLTDRRTRLENYSQMLGGHPLALRIFAGACLEQPFDEPELVSAHICSPQDVESMPDPDESGLSKDERQKRRQRRQFYKLLRWFQQKLPPSKRRLLQLVALFRDPVLTDTLVALATGLEDMKGDFEGSDGATIPALLEQLCAQSLLQKESDGDYVHWTAHPIVRDVFRREALAAGDAVAQQFARIVAGKGEHSRVRTEADILPVVESIDVLIAATDFEAADALFRSRLEEGNVFVNIPAPQIGLRCLRSILNPLTRSKLDETLGLGRVGFYLAWEALIAGTLGEMDCALTGHEQGNVFDHKRKAWAQVSVGLQNIADAQILSGNLREALLSADEALFYAGTNENVQIQGIQLHGPPSGIRRGALKRPNLLPPLDQTNERTTRAYRAHVLSLTGRLAAASSEFAAADALSRRNEPNNPALYSIWGHFWSIHRNRLGETSSVHRIVRANRAICEKYEWNSDSARCDLILDEASLNSGDHILLVSQVAKAVQVFRDAKQYRDLPDALLAMARLRQTEIPERNFTMKAESIGQKRNVFAYDESPLSHCEEALRLAARSGFLLKKCDALNLRCQLLREKNQLEEALTDAIEAHEVAIKCDYYWGRREALSQLCNSHRALGNSADARQWEDAERSLAQKMAPEIAEALRINREHDATMLRLYHN